MDSIRTKNLIIHTLTRKLPLVFDTATHAINTTSPNSLGGIEVAMGIAGQDGMVTIAIDAASGGNRALSAWTYSALAAQWLKLGASSSSYQKTFESGTIDGFVIPEKAAFFVTSDVAIVNAWTDCEKHPNNPNG